MSLLTSAKERLILWYIQRTTEDYVRRHMDKIKGLAATAIIGALIAGVQAGIQVYNSGQADPALLVGAFVTGAVAFWMRSPKDKK